MNDGIGGGIHDACRILAQRPDVRIATGSVTARLRPELAALSLDLPVRPMQSCRLEAVFTGNGRMFCAGGCRAECFDSCVNTGSNPLLQTAPGDPKSFQAAQAQARELLASARVFLAVPRIKLPGHDEAGAISGGPAAQALEIVLIKVQ